MKRAVKAALLLPVFLFLVLPGLAYLAYDTLWYQVRVPEIRRLIDSAAEQDRHPPVQVVRMLKVSERHGTAKYSAALLARTLQVMPERQRMLAWHLRSALWQSFVALHLSEVDQITLILSLAPTGPDRHGFSNTARELYGRSPSELDLEEIATIVALIRSPAGAGNPTIVEHSRDLLLRRYAAGS